MRERTKTAPYRSYAMRVPAGLVALFVLMAAPSAQAEIVRTPATPTFTTVPGKSPKKRVTLTNARTPADPSPAPARITALAVTAGAPAFSLVVPPAITPCAAPLAVKESCAFEVQFAPPNVGPFAGELTYTVNGGAPTVAPLKGTGVLPSTPELTPSSLSFTAATGNSSRRQVTVTNTGPVSLTLRRAPAVIGADGASFAITTTCGKTLAPGASCDVSVTFAPTAARTYVAMLRITTDAGRRPTDRPATSTQDVALEGSTSGGGSGSTGSRGGKLDTGVFAVWRPSKGLTRLVSMSVRAPVGSRIDIRCTGKRGACPFGTRIIKKTVKRTTNITARFKAKRSLREGTAITIRVTKRGAIGTLHRFTMRRGKKPKVATGCTNDKGIVRRCP